MRFKASLILLPAAGLLMAANSVTAQTLTVGPAGGGCDHTSIQDAVNAAPPDGTTTRIRVVTGAYNENVLIHNKNIDLLGGYTNCSATSPVGFSTILGGNAGPALRLNATSANRGFRVERFNLSGGLGDSFDPGGGLNIFSSDGRFATVDLVNTWIYGNSSTVAGGGVALTRTGSGSAELRLHDNSRIYNNSVTGTDPRGGGLFCEGGFTITMNGGGISNNTTGAPVGSSGRGGGVFLNEGCQFNFVNTHNNPGQLTGNSAFAGGGLYAGGGAGALFSSRPGLPPFVATQPLYIEGNRAEGSGVDALGAGVWAEGTGTVVDLWGVWVRENNNVNGNGGGIAATDGAWISVSRAFGNDCHSGAECSLIAHNRAGDTGGAIYAREATVRATQTVIRNNAALVGAGADVFASTGANIQVWDSLITRGSGPNGLPGAPDGPNNYTFWIANDANLDLWGTTVADSEPNERVFRFGGSGSVLNMTHVIVHEQSNVGMFRLNGTPTANVECVLWHSDALTNLDGHQPFHLVADPLFVDRDDMNFQLQPDSPAVDFCDGLAPREYDLLHRPRGVQTKPEMLHGPYDLGAFEFQGNTLFSDRFED